MARANYPNTIQLGDVTKWREWDIDWSTIDLLIGGSPCQGFSFAGKQLAFDDPRSKLFFVYVDILNHIKSVNPRIKFMLENVKMKKEFLAVITDMLGVEPVFINSALLSAQNRQRYYWANWQIEQPEDKGIVLADILEDAVTNCLTTVQKDNLVRVGTASDIRGHDCLKRIYSATGKAPTLTTMGGGHREPKVSLNDDAESFDMNVTYRKLTPIECERLQTFSDGYTAHVSNTQRYKALGNSWTVDVVSHIFNQANWSDM